VGITARLLGMTGEGGKQGGEGGGRCSKREGGGCRLKAALCVVGRIFTVSYRLSHLLTGIQCLLVMTAAMSCVSNVWVAMYTHLMFEPSAAPQGVKHHNHSSEYTL